MDVRKRINTCLLLLEMKKNKEVARRLGLIDVSKNYKEGKNDKERRGTS